MVLNILGLWCVFYSSFGVVKFGIVRLLVMVCRFGMWWVSFRYLVVLWVLFYSMVGCSMWLCVLSSIVLCIWFDRLMVWVVVKVFGVVLCSLLMVV